MKQGPEVVREVMGKAMTPEDLNIGDHIFRYGLHGIYSHHGIYIDNGYVIHFTRTEDKKTICPSLSKTSHKQQSCPNFPECENQNNIKRGVVKTCVDCFCRDGKKLRPLYCYGYRSPRLGFMLARPGTCTTLPFTKSPDQVVGKASELHANNAFGNYSLMNNNCEHFALFCRTDTRKSEQTAFFSDCERKIMQAKEWTARLLQRNWILVVQPSSYLVFCLFVFYYLFQCILNWDRNGDSIPYCPHVSNCHCNSSSCHIDVIHM